MDIRFEESGRRRITSDEFNQRVYLVEYRCVGCNEWVTEEETVWCHHDGTLNTDTGHPFCVSCCPEEG